MHVYNCVAFSTWKWSFWPGHSSIIWQGIFHPLLLERPQDWQCSSSSWGRHLGQHLVVLPIFLSMFHHKGCLFHPERSSSSSFVFRGGNLSDLISTWAWKRHRDMQMELFIILPSSSTWSFGAKNSAVVLWFRGGIYLFVEYGGTASLLGTIATLSRIRASTICVWKNARNL